MGFLPTTFPNAPATPPPPPILFDQSLNAFICYLLFEFNLTGRETRNLNMSLQKSLHTVRI